MRYVLVSLLLLGFSIGCSKDYVTGKSSYNWFGIKKDVSLGKQVLNAQLQAFKKGQKYQGKAIEVDVDQEQLARLQTIVKRLAKVSHLPNLPYEVHLAEIPVPNAWAAPGGKMMVFSGLWDPEKGLVDKGNDDQLAAVLAHEMSHATARHVTESLSTHMTIMMAGTVASSAIGATGSTLGSNLFGNFFSFGYNIFAPTYSRKNEYEADRIGLFYMSKAGYDPRVAVEVWKKASKKKGDYTTIFASHPGSGDRAKALERYLPEAMKLYKNPNQPYPDFGDLKKNYAEKKAEKSQEDIKEKEGIQEGGVEEGGAPKKEKIKIIKKNPNPNEL